MTIRFLPPTLAGIALAAQLPYAAAAPPDGVLGDLLRQEVTSVSRRVERVSDAAAAVHVISAHDIRRSGARSVPEALRLAPGVDAVRLSANRWSVSIRGFNDRFANKLLVLVDGRNAYSPLFSGVFWESMLMPLSEIERIEVIRGPGAVAWGTNATNGVINIITKSTVATNGLLASVSGGDRDGVAGSLRVGGQLDDSNVHYRMYTAFQDGEPYQHVNGSEAFDDYESKTVGARMDGYLPRGDRWSLSAEYVDVASDSESLTPVPTPPFVAPARTVQTHRGYNLRGRFQGAAAWADYEVQAAFAHTNTDVPDLGSDLRDTFDLDGQLRLGSVRGHSLLVGGGVRVTSDETGDGLRQEFTGGRKETVVISSLYLQDDVSLRPNLALTAGLRLEHQDVTGVEAMPTVRLRWNATPTRVFWASVARAVRAPSPGERRFSYTVGFVQPPMAPQSVPIVVQGSDDYGSEYLLATELGYREQITPRAYLDLTLFHHDYDDVRSFGGDPQSTVSQLDNSGDFSLYGGELAASWRPFERWELRGAYTHVDIGRSNLRTAEAEQLATDIANLQIGFELNAALTVSLSSYLVSDRNVRLLPGQDGLDSFNTTNLTARWQARPNLELWLTGNNLLDDGHVEARSTTVVRQDTVIQRGIHAGLRLQY